MWLRVNGSVGVSAVSRHRRIPVISLSADPSKLDQLQAERLHLFDDAEHRGAILEQAGQDGLASVDVMDHRGEGREHGGAEAAIDPDAVQIVRSLHAPPFTDDGWG